MVEILSARSDDFEGWGIKHASFLYAVHKDHLFLLLEVTVWLVVCFQFVYIFVSVLSTEVSFIRRDRFPFRLIFLRPCQLQTHAGRTLTATGGQNLATRVDVTRQLSEQALLNWTMNIRHRQLQALTSTSVTSPAM